MHLPQFIPKAFRTVKGYSSTYTRARHPNILTFFKTSCGFPPDPQAVEHVCKPNGPNNVRPLCWTRIYRHTVNGIRGHLLPCRRLSPDMIPPTEVDRIVRALPHYFCCVVSDIPLEIRMQRRMKSPHSSPKWRIFSFVFGFGQLSSVSVRILIA